MGEARAGRSMTLDEWLEYIETELRAEAALPQGSAVRARRTRRKRCIQKRERKDLGKIVYELACGQHLPKGSADPAQRRLYDLAVKLKVEGLDEALLRDVFNYLNRFYVKLTKSNPI